MKKTLKIVFSSLLLVFLFNISVFADQVPEVAAEGMILIDATTGEIIAKKNHNEQLAPASTTKIMTALLTLENTKLDDVVTVGKNPPFADGSSIALKEGDMYTVENLLHALLLESSNDSAMALAEHISGTEENFAKMMTEKAKSLGANNTNFINSSGLYDENHYTTAYDLSLIMKEVIKFEDFIRISQVISYELPISKVDGQTKWVNNSTTLYNPNNSNYYPELLAAKTGYTSLARSTYVASAKKDNQILISVLLKSEGKYQNFIDTKNLFDYGFNNFDLIKLYNTGDIITTIKIDENTEVPLTTPNDIFYLKALNKENLSRGSTNSSSLKTTINLEQKDLSKENFNSGDIILKADLFVENKLYITIPLSSTITREYTISDNIINFFKLNLLWIILFFLITVLLIFKIKDKLFYFRYRKKAKKIIFKNKKRLKL